MAKYYAALKMEKNIPIEVGDFALDLTDMRLITVTKKYLDKDMDGGYVTMIGDGESASNKCVRVKMSLFETATGKYVGALDETADWIKEGMEFEEEDVEGFMWAGNRDQYGYFVITRKN